MHVKKHIPNLLTLGNLFCGTLATIFAVHGDFTTTAFLVVIGIGFDFLDGFAARLLNVQGELGKQLDSLADMVTSGVVPGIVMLQLIYRSNFSNDSNLLWNNIDVNSLYQPFGISIELIGILLTLAACYRLAKFNIDTRQSDSFIGLPTPAMCLFVISLPLILQYSEIAFVNDIIQNTYFLIGVTLVLSFLMNAELPLFSLKFKDYSFKNNVIKYLFLLLSVVLLVVLKFVAIPTIILLYVIMSIISNYGKKGTV